MRDLRTAQLAAPPETDTHPDKSEAWEGYRMKWFTPVHRCAGAECDVRQPPETSPGRYALLGLDTQYNPTAGYFAVSARGTVVRYAEDINPFVYALTASLGYRHYTAGGNAGFFGVGFDFALPVGYKAAIGFTPAELRAVFGGPSDGTEVVTRLLRFDYAASEKLHLTVEAPLEVNWRKPQAQWSFVLGLSYALSTPRLVAGSTLLRHEEKAERKDEAWGLRRPLPTAGSRDGSPPSTGSRASPVTTPPADALPGTDYGLGMLGAEMSWDRDRWGGRYAFTPAVSLEAGIRRTSGESAYVTGTLGLGVRWYFLGPLGLSVTAVRVEGGPRVRGWGDIDTSQGSTAPRPTPTTCWPARGSAWRSASASSTSSSRRRRSPGPPIPSARARSSASGSASG